MTSSGSTTLVQRVLDFRDDLEEKGLSHKLFLVGFALYLVWKMWSSTTLAISDGSPLNTAIHLVCLLFFGFAILLTAGFDAQSALLFVVLCLGVVSKLVTDDIWLFDLTMLIGASRTTEFRTAAKVWFVITGVMALMTVLGSQVGIFVDYLWTRGTQIRHGLGFSYTTHASSLLLALTLVWVYFRQEKFSLVEAAVILGLDVVIYLLTYSRNSFGFTIVIVLAALVLKLKRVRDALPVAFLRVCAQYSFIIVALLSLFVTWAYDAEDSTWQRLNEVMSNRLEWTQISFQTYGIQIFGQDIELAGNGLAVVDSELVLDKEYNEDADTYYVDNGYLKTLLFYGPIVFVAFVMLFVLAGRHAASSRNVWLCAILGVIALHLFIDGTFRGIRCDPFIVLAWKATCDFVEQSSFGTAVRSKLPACQDASVKK